MAKSLDELVNEPLSFDALVLARAEEGVAGRAQGGLSPVEYDRQFGWVDFAKLAGQAAAYLEARDIGPGDRIAICGQNSLAWIVWLAAAAWRGAALIAIHPNLEAENLLAALGQTKPAWLFADQRSRNVELGEIAQEAAEKAQLSGVTIMPGGDGLLDLSAVLDVNARPPSPQGSLDTPLNIQFTSGSTGRPKVVMLSHRALIVNAALTAQTSGIGPGDRMAAPLPLFHSAGLSTGAILSFVSDASWVGFHRFHTETVLDNIIARECTAIIGVPTMYATLLDRMAQTETATPSLRMGIIGGDFFPPDLCQRTVETMGLAHLSLVYGQTEFAPTITVSRGDEPPEYSYTTCGPPLPGVTVRIVDPDSGENGLKEEVGEIWVKGPTMMSGYFDDPQATAAAITPDGWLRTGDLGRVLGGCLQVTARLKELIIRGGENVSPYEVEEALRTATGVADVCVAPMPSDHWGEEICAVLVADRNETIAMAALRNHAQSNLPRHMRPDQYLIWSELPLLANGKVDRWAVKEAVVAGEII